MVVHENGDCDRVENLIELWNELFERVMGHEPASPPSRRVAEDVIDLYGGDAEAAVRVFWTSKKLTWVDHVKMTWLTNPDNKDYVLVALRPRNMGTRAEFTRPRSDTTAIKVRKKGTR